MDSAGQLPPERGVFCNRTLNMRAIRTIGYDMDYTLVRYKEDEWEQAAFEHARGFLAEHGWPVGDLVFDAAAFTTGLVFDLDLGNVCKATRFGYVVKAQHGAETMSFDQMRNAYREAIVELSDDRFIFMNTLFELSRACLFSQLVELHDEGKLSGVHSYEALYARIDDALNQAHNMGKLKEGILADPERFVELDPEVVSTLREQRAAGKQLLLITNSDWSYTRSMMAWTFDRFCPEGTTWRDLFDIVIVSANKPRSFADTDPIYRVVDEKRSLLEPHHGPLEPGSVYFGGNAGLVEQSLRSSGSQPLYVGDHLFGDVHVTKDVLRWRTALIASELEGEIRHAIDFAPTELELGRLMSEKTVLEQRQARARLARLGGGEGGDDLDRVGADLAALDDQIAPLARAASDLGNPTWGPLMRSGNDKSLFARQVERYADIYTSRVSNLRAVTPFAYLRAARGSLPHDHVVGGDPAP